MTPNVPIQLRARVNRVNCKKLLAIILLTSKLETELQLYVVFLFTFVLNEPYIFVASAQ